MKKTQKNKAITLVALVITMVILIILAGISINMLFGENGIINKAKMGKTKFLGEDAREVVEQRVAALKQDSAQKGVDTTLYDFWFMYNSETLEDGSQNKNFKDDMAIYLFTDELSAKFKPATKKASRPADSIANCEANYDKNIEYKTSIVVYNDYIVSLDKEVIVSSGVMNVDADKTILSTLESANINNGTLPNSLEGKLNNLNITISSQNQSESEPLLEVNVSNETSHTANLLTYTWEEMSTFARSIALDSSVNSETVEVTVGNDVVLGLGDTIKLKGTVSVNSVDTTYDYTVRIIGFKHDDLTNTNAYGINTTKAGITFEFTEVYKYDKINYTSAINFPSNAPNIAYSNSLFRETLNNSINLLENSSYIKEVVKESNYNTTTYTSNEKLWLLSGDELFSDGGWIPYSTTNDVGGYQYKYYKILPNVPSYGCGGAYVKKGMDYILRSHGNGNEYDYFNHQYGFCNSSHGADVSSTSYGICPCFCL